MPGPATKSGLQGPSGVALDARGDLFIADWANNVVEEVTPTGELSIAVGNGDEAPPTPAQPPVPLSGAQMVGPPG